MTKGTGFSSSVDECIEDLRIISLDPFDKKLLKEELYNNYSDYTIKLARKLIRENNKRESE